MQTLVQDVRYALGQFLRNPGFTITAVISLALGIGATTAIFSIVYAALINPYPYRAVDRIVRLTLASQSGPGDWINLTGPQIRQVRQLPAIESVLAMEFHQVTLTGGELPINVSATGFIATGFQDLGVPPALGRGLWPTDAIDGQEPQPVAVLSYQFWAKQFASDPGIVGKSLQLDHKNYLIVGVAAPRFTWYVADVYVPLQLTEDPDVRCVVDLRLRPGVSRAAADAQLQPLVNQFAKDFPKRFPEHFNVRVEGLNERVVKGMSETLYLLLGAVGLLLAIGCGNVSILLLARGTARQHELAVRVALGAHRGRIVRQLLTESVLLAALGLALGVLMSYGILAGIKLFLPRYAFAPEVVIHINLPVLFVSGGVALATGILFGLWPALQLSRAGLGRIMRTSARRVAGTVHGRRTHDALMAGQIALTLLLLAGAGSAMKDFVRLMHTPLGYDPHNALSLGVPLRTNSQTTWAARAVYMEQLRAKASETPGVIATAISGNATPPRNGWDTRFEILGTPAMEQRKGSVDLVSPEYFAVLRIPLLEGRLWTDTENRNGARVAVINRTFARRYFPNGDAIGHSLQLPDIEDQSHTNLTPSNISASWLEIVGVVGDARNDGLKNPVKPAAYIPFTRIIGTGTQILVRAEVPPLSLAHALRAQLAAVNPDQQTYSNIEDLDSWVSDVPEWQQEHLSAWIFGIFAGLALALAAVGLYSVVSYTVAQRTSEFGIRVALGAPRGHVLRIVLASTLVSVGIGILAGLALTAALNTLSRDPLILLSGSLLLTLVSAIACAIPAWRASTTDAMSALRCE